MELRQAIAQRKSIRVFKPDPVPRELIKKVLAAGMLAPSSANMQPWDFVVLGGEEKNRLSRELLQDFSVGKILISAYIMSNLGNKRIYL